MLIVPKEFLLDGKSNFIFCGVMCIVVIFFWEDWILRGFIWIASSFNLYFFELKTFVIDYYFSFADLCADYTLLFLIFIKFLVDPKIIFSLAIISYPSFRVFFPGFAVPKSPMIFIFVSLMLLAFKTAFYLWIEGRIELLKELRGIAGNIYRSLSD